MDIFAQNLKKKHKFFIETEKNDLSLEEGTQSCHGCNNHSHSNDV